MFNQGAVNLGSAYGSIDVDLSQAQRKLEAAVRAYENGIAGMFNRVGNRLQSIGSSMTLALSPVTIFAVKGISAYADFDEILTEVAARTGATADQMERVKATALQMGQDTAFSANQAADAMLQLLSSGYDLEETFAALEPVLNLAAAGSLDLGYAADAVTDILAQFKLGAEDAASVSDALAQASGSSSATIDQLIDAFANVGPLASNFGLSVEDTAAILAVFAENGIKGAESGTQLKSMLTNLAQDTPAVRAMWDDLGVSLFDSQGNFRDLNTVIEDLGIAMAGMSDDERNNAIQTLAGSYGQMGLQILLAAGGYDEMAASMEGAATAEELAAAKMESFKGKTNQLKSSLETLSLNVLAPLVENYLEPLVMGLTEVINKVNEWLVANPELANGIGIIVGILATMGPVIFAVGHALSLLAVFLNPISLVTAAIAGLAFAFREQLAPAVEFVKDALSLFTSGKYSWRTVETLGNPIDGVAAKILKLREIFTSLGERVSYFVEFVRDAFNLFASGKYSWRTVDTLGNPIDGVAAKILKLREEFISVGERVAHFIKFIKDAFNLFTSGQYRWAMFDTLGSRIDGVAAKILNLRETFLSAANRVRWFVEFVKDAFNLFTSGEYSWRTVETLGNPIDGVAAKILKLREEFISVGERVAHFIKFIKDAFNLFTSGQYRWAMFDTLGSRIDGVAAKILNLRETFLSAANRVRWFVEFVKDAFNLLTSGQYSWTTVETLGNPIDGIAAKILRLREIFVTAFNAVAGFFKANNLSERINDLLEPLGGLNTVLEWIAKTVIGILVPPLGTLMTLISLVQLGFEAMASGAGDPIKGIKNLFGNLAEATSDFIHSIPAALEYLAESFVNWVEPMLPQLMQALGQIGQSILTWLDQVIPQVVSGALRLGTAFLEWIGTAIRMLLPALGYMLGQAIRWLMTEGIPRILPALNEFLVAVGNFIINDLVPGIIGFGVLLVHGFLQGIRELISSGQLEQWAIDILHGIADGFAQMGSFVSWVYNNLIVPLGNAIAEYINSGKLWDDLKRLGESFLTAIGIGITLLGEVGQWVYDNLIVPLAEGVSQYVTSGQLWEDLQRLGDGILSAIGAGIELSNDIVTWVYNNLIVPLAEGVAQYVLSGQLRDDLVALGNSIFDGIGAGLKAIADIQSWVYSKVILPIAFGIRDYVTSGQLWDDLVALGTGIFNAIGAGIAAIGDIVEWVLNNLIIPLGNAALEYVGSGKLWEDLMALGKSILDGLAAGLGSVADWVQSNVIDPILNPLETARDIINGLTNTETTIGGSWRGRGDQQGDGTLPNPSGRPRDNGGIGRAGSIYRVGAGQLGAEFFGVGDQGHFYPDFMDNLTRIAGMVMRQSMPQFRGAEDQLLNAGGGGNVYNLEINIPLDVLRDEPNLQRNADTFADQIMSRLRSR